MKDFYGYLFRPVNFNESISKDSVILFENKFSKHAAVYTFHFENRSATPITFFKRFSKIKNLIVNMGDFNAYIYEFC